MLGMAGAFVFAAQMLNFPVPGGTSGHLIGGVLTAILLGPNAAVLVMACVLIVQCLMFADGGLLALGANTFNMGIVSVWAGYLAFRAIKTAFPMEHHRGTVFAAAFAGWFGTVVSSITCAGQLALSNTAPWSAAFPAMANVHMLIGVGEGLATGLITLAVLRNRPELAHSAVPDRQSFVMYGVLLSIGLAVFVAPFASPLPDGLEKVAERLGFAGHESTHLVPSPMTDYSVPFLSSAAAGTAIAGIVGTILAFAAAYVLARTVAPALPGRPPDARADH
jgi:cobalt/nickel transport system permease protein